MGVNLGEGFRDRCFRRVDLRRRRRVDLRRRRRCGVTGGSTADVSAAEAAGLSRTSMSSALLTSFSSEVIRLPVVKPDAASFTSSKLFLRSAISASRMASWNWPWNSAAILRALPIHCPTMRSTPGSSFGPMAISATTAMTAISLHPISNMNDSAHARRSHPNTCQTRFGPPASPQPVLPRVVPQAGVQTALLPTSDRAAAEDVAL